MCAFHQQNQLLELRGKSTHTPNTIGADLAVAALTAAIEIQEPRVARIDLGRAPVHDAVETTDGSPVIIKTLELT